LTDKPVPSHLVDRRAENQSKRTHDFSQTRQILLIYPVQSNRSKSHPHRTMKKSSRFHASPR